MGLGLGGRAGDGSDRQTTREEGSYTCDVSGLYAHGKPVESLLYGSRSTGCIA